MAGGVRLIVFDFDQTLSCVHVFKSLAGWGESKMAQKGILKVPRPFACTERGQVRRIDELNRTEPFHKDGFARVAFGGERRLEELRSCLTALAGRGLELMICTKGLVGAVKKCLTDLRLLDFFSEVYGNVGGDAYGETAYDRAAASSEIGAVERTLLGSQSQGGWRTKAELIARLLAQRRLRPQQGVLVEDDPEEIRKATGACKTYWVREAEGLTTADLAALLRLTEPEGAGGATGRDPAVVTTPPSLGTACGPGARRLQPLPRPPLGGTPDRPPSGLSGGTPDRHPGEFGGGTPDRHPGGFGGGGTLDRRPNFGLGGGGSGSRPGSGERVNSSLMAGAAAVALGKGSPQARQVGRSCSMPIDPYRSGRGILASLGAGGLGGGGLGDLEVIGAVHAPPPMRRREPRDRPRH